MIGGRTDSAEIKPTIELGQLRSGTGGGVMSFRSLFYASETVVVCAMLAICALGTSCESADKGEVEALIDTFESLRGDAKIPGLAVAIIHNSEVVAMTGLGYASIEKEVPVDADTRYRIHQYDHYAAGLLGQFEGHHHRRRYARRAHPHQAVTFRS